MGHRFETESENSIQQPTNLEIRDDLTCLGFPLP